MAMSRGRIWKILGVAGLAGVAASGVVVARDHRRRTQLSPEEVRDRLRARLDESGSSPQR